MSTNSILLLLGLDGTDRLLGEFQGLCGDKATAKVLTQDRLVPQRCLETIQKIKPDTVVHSVEGPHLILQTQAKLVWKKLVDPEGADFSGGSERWRHASGLSDGAAG